MGDDDDVKTESGSRVHGLCSLPDFGNEDLAKLQALLDGGADPELVDAMGCAPLLSLCKGSGHLGAAKALLTAGASPSCHVAGARTSLHWCCNRGWVTTAELLLDSGALVDECTKQGDAPMHWAAKAGDAKLVELLKSGVAGSDPLPRNDCDKAALDVAADEIVRTLISCKLLFLIRNQALEIRARPPVRKPEEDPQTEKPPAQALQTAPVPPDSRMPRTTSSERSRRALAGLPMGGQTGTSGGPLFSAYKKQPMSLGPKKMKITLKKK